MKKVLKIVISIALLGVLIYSADWENIWSHLVSANLFLLSIVFIIRILQFPISAYKWGKCLEIHDLQYSFPFLQKILCIGFFFNNFLPTSIGGDGYRVMKTLPKGDVMSRAVSAILLERIIGFAVLLVLGFIGSAFVIFRYDAQIIRLYLLAGSIGIVLFLLFLILHAKGFIKKIIDRLVKIKKLEAISLNLNYIKAGGVRLLNVAVVSTVFHLLAVTSIVLLFKTFDTQSYFSDCTVIAALMGFVSVLPISINGVGVAEGSFVYTAAQVGISFNEAIIVAFMIRTMNLIAGLFCGVLYFADSRK